MTKQWWDSAPLAEQSSGNWWESAPIAPSIPTREAAALLPKQPPGLVDRALSFFDRMAGNTSVMDELPANLPLPAPSPQAALASDRVFAQNRMAREIESARRADFARANPKTAALAAGSARTLAGTLDAVPLAADAVNHYLVNPVLQATGAAPLAPSPRMPEAAALDAATQDYTPQIARRSLAGAWNNDQFGEWLGANLAQQAPQVAQSLGAALVPALRTPALLGMGAQAAGNEYTQNKAEGAEQGAAIVDALTKGNIEVLSEMLPLGVFDKVKDVMLKIPTPVRGQVMAEALKRVAAGGGALTAQGITGAIEESVAQIGGNLSENLVLGKDTALMKGVPESAVVGAVAGKVMGIPNAVQAASGPLSAEQEIARAIEQTANDVRFTVPADQVAREQLSPDNAQIVRELTGKLDQEGEANAPTVQPDANATRLPADAGAAVQPVPAAVPDAAVAKTGIPVLEQNQPVTEATNAQPTQPAADPVDAAQPAHAVVADNAPAAAQPAYELPAQLTERATQIDTPTEGLRPGDIVAASGKPFKTKAQAQAEAKAAGKGWQVKRGGAGFVVRYQPPSAAQIANAKRLAKVQTQIDTERDSLFAAIAKLGGIHPDALTKEWGFDPKEVASLRGAGIKRVANRNGRSLDSMAEALAELGYLSYDDNGKHSVDEFFDLFDGEIRGNKHYTPQGFERQAQAARDAEYAEWEAKRIDELSEADIEASAFDQRPDEAKDAIEEALDRYEELTDEDEADLESRIEREGIRADSESVVDGTAGENGFDPFAEEGSDRNAAQADARTPRQPGAAEPSGDAGEGAGRDLENYPDVPFSRSGVTNTPEFRRWFGDSKVVDENGKPLVVYHGTTADFDAFDPALAGAVGDRFADATFFTSSPVVASGYSQRLSDDDVHSDLVRKEDEARRVYGPAVVEQFNATKTTTGSIVAPAKAKYDAAVEARRKRREAVFTNEVPIQGANVIPTYLRITKPVVIDAKGENYHKVHPTAFEKAEAIGADGIIIRNVFDSANEYAREASDIFIVFKPEQIKSAAGNRGTFDPANPDITMSRGSGSGMTVDDVRAAIATDTFHHDVDIYATLDEAPDYVRAQAKREGATDVEGFWDKRTNRVALIAENIASANRAREVARHELIGHYGLENMVGSDAMDRLASRVIRAENDGNKTIRELAAQVDKTQPDLDAKRRAKEIIAVMAERNIQNSITRRVMDAIRAFLKKIGFTKADITDAEIATLLRDAQSYLRDKGRGMVAAQPAAAFSRYGEKVALDLDAPLAQQPYDTRYALRGEIKRLRAEAWNSGDKSVDPDTKDQHVTGRQLLEIITDRLGSEKEALDYLNALGVELAKESAFSRNDARMYEGGQENETDRSELQANQNLLTIGGGTARSGWAGATGIRGIDGQPAPVYRGAAIELTDEHFAFGALGSATGHPSSGLGVWFSLSEKQAAQYGDVEEFRLDIRNPKEFTVDTFPAFDSLQAAYRFREQLRAQGYDGIVVDARNIGGPVNAVAFEPEQVIIPGSGIASFSVAPPTALEEGRPLTRDEVLAKQEADAKAAKEEAKKPAAPKQKNVTADQVDMFAEQGSLFSRSGAQRIDHGQDDLPFAPRSAFTVSEPVVFDNVIRALQNNKIDLKRVQEAIRANGGVITEQQDAYLNEELYIGRVTDQIDRFVDRRVTPLLEAITRAGLTTDEVNQYLYARHAPERNAQLQRINPNRINSDRLSGMSNARAAEIMADFNENGKAEKLKVIAAMVDNITRDNRRRIVSAGLEPADMVARWEGAYQHYVPLMADMDVQVGRKKGGYNVKGNESERALGQLEESQNILANVIAQAQSVIIRGEKAKVARSLLDLARNHPNDKFWKVDEAPKKRRVNPDTGLVEWAEDPLFKNRDNVLVVKENGEEHFIVFNEKNERAMRIAEAMQNLDAAQLPWVIEASGKVTRYLATWITARNPLFWITNFARDVQGAAFNLQNTEIAGKEAQVIASIPKALAGYRNLIRGDGQSQWAQYAREFKAAGSETGYIKVFDSPEDHMADLEKQVEEMRQGKADPRRLARALVEAIDDYNTIIENGVRLAVYQTARSNGVSIRKAASMAKNITVNFNRKGSQSTAFNALYMFFNASIQGNARFLTAVATSRRAQVVAATLVGMGFVLDAVNRAIGGDDDETGRSKYDQIPLFERERNWIFMDPSGSGKYVKIPMPYGPHVALNVGRIGSELAFGPKADFVEQALGLAMVAVDAFNPMGANGSLSQYIAPSIVKPAVQIGENKSFTGGPLYREADERGYAGPAYTRHFRSTGDHWVQASKLLNETTGGDKITPGKVDVPPEVLRTLLVSYLTPGLTQTADKAATTAESAAAGKKVEPSQIPALSRFYGEAPEERSQERIYFEEKRKIDQQIGRIKQYAKEGNREGMDRALAELGDGDKKKGAKIRAKWESAESSLMELNQQRRQLENDKVPDDKQRTQLDRIDERRMQLIRRVLR